MSGNPVIKNKLLTLVAQYGAQSCDFFAKLLELPMRTVGDNLDALVNEGSLRKFSAYRGKNGRPKTLFGVVKNNG